MPIYEYRCAECGHELEVWAKISDPAPESCPSCQARALKKAVSRTTFALKGGGWYAQGYGAGGGAKKASSSSSTSSTSSDSGSSSSSASSSSASSSSATASSD